MIDIKKLGLDNSELYYILNRNYSLYESRIFTELKYLYFCSVYTFVSDKLSVDNIFSEILYNQCNRLFSNLKGEYSPKEIELLNTFKKSKCKLISLYFRGLLGFSSHKADCKITINNISQLVEYIKNIDEVLYEKTNS